ncbi:MULTISPECIES: DNA-packaging protein [unclassified Aurantimonas]|uniref:DNA-packaging protein n=1 Tax=unclassified Aurantimonas TaxID=2638230 RepID=UPI002E17AE61|nr:MULTISPECIES: terminase family protein [unclassified Aurantimonas]MEC5289400.1 terminase family protein [Aurantimonas sp. C2-3-R2]MEC5410480.1 terminase family protein [Aurantimonas sp. C2-4-R8]
MNLSSIARLPPEQIKAALAGLTDGQCEALVHDWRFIARDTQIEPEGDWQNWMILAGRGFGKTRTGAEWVREQVKAGAGRIHLIAPTASDARDVMVEGESGLLSVCWAGDKTHDGVTIGRPAYEPSKRRLTWANGAVATMFSAEEPERLRGPQSERIWADELAAWKYLRETWDMAMFGLRLGDHPRTCITTTPKPLPVVREIAKDARTVVTRGSTFDNAGNLSPSFMRAIEDKYAGTRLGRQELNAELLDDVPGALWTRDMIDEARKGAVLPDMSRIVVAVDPSGTRGDEDEGDSIGIVVVGKGVDGLAYVLADRTCKLSPDGWGRRAVDAYHEFKADRIIAERNYGGAMVEHVIRTVDRSVSYSEVVASRGKVVRAEPIAALYEQHRVKHIAGLDQLEDQQCAMTGEGYLGDGSPDRVDAAVWALTDLMITGSNYNLAAWG